MLLPSGAALVAVEALGSLKCARMAAASALSQQRRNIAGSTADDGGAESNMGANDAPPSGPWIARLPSRGVISVSGPDALPFLQGLVTNDVRPLEDAAAPAVYAALVTPKGKLLHDMFIARCSGGGGGGGGEGVRLLLDVDAGGAAGALAWLARYKLRRAVALDDATADYSVWARFPSSSSAAAGAGDGNGASTSTSGSASGSASPGGLLGTGWWRDPRLPGGRLGERRIAPAAATAAALGTADGGGGGGADGDGGVAAWREAPAAAHRLLRYSLGVAEGSEAPRERFAPLEANLDALGGVSYSKGCYIGQERNSYTHFRGIVRRRVMPVRLVGGGGGNGSGGGGSGSGSSGSSSGSSSGGGGGASGGFEAGAGVEVVEVGGGAVGTLLAAEGQLGLAHLKLGPALAAAAGHNVQLRLASGGGAAGAVEVVPVRPDWWPPEWGHEEGAL